ncbi:RecQ family ATP-dependent DNA helicase [Allostreptomyces psammosilenae]|uniref:DNA 3'-5' helicase n=1 Tax=Allostreptomyces psammosilenae TaxID=1892865 RepID=A0A852ZXV1_9ACTN|nr:DEAD/DEAH box helicase [Allostreptomyces psammosilenae]NYI03112.1 ATP-dependent DNA helicase RecQ [Allostreptomyces psammosilenae]
MPHHESTATIGADERAALRRRADEVLVRLVGGEARLREDQWRAIEALVVDRRRALVVQRTGWGKSAVYFVATALLRERGHGPTVIVSPLIALMRNQVEAAGRAGIHARTINSANIEEWKEIQEDVSRSAVDVLLVSPERLNNPDFRDNLLPELAASAGLVVVDEAHCISDWGHDFRPDYRRLRTLLADLGESVPVLATTATANARVTADVAEQLGTTGGGLAAADGAAANGAAGALVLRGPLSRDSLSLGVLSLPDPAHRLAWLADHLPRLAGSGIVYTLTVSAAEEVAAFLRGRGLAVAAYSSRTEDAERRAAEADLQANRIKALVATSALGMGFDKPDLGFVVHLGSPQSPIAYYQQVGRAGRGVDRAEVLLLPGREDEAIWRYFAQLAFPEEERVRATLDVLAQAPGPMSTAALESRVDLRRSRLEAMLKVLDVDGAVRRVRGGWTATGRPWRHDTERFARVAEARAAEQQAMREYVGTDRCRMEFLQRQLDDATAAPCGRCDNCAGPWRTAEVSTESLDAARAALGRPGVTIEPRRMWPTAMTAVGLDLKGRIPPGEQAAPGRALGRLTDIGWGGTLRALLAPQQPDGPLPEDVLAAVVTVLGDWARGPGGWASADAAADRLPRPVGVVTIASLSRPRMVESLGEHLAAVGRMPLLGRVEYAPGRERPPGSHNSNSAQRLRAVHGAFTVPDALSARLSAVPGPVFLVDDRVDSGWTMTEAARLLRRAGVPAVLPVALAVES